MRDCFRPGILVFVSCILAAFSSRAASTSTGDLVGHWKAILDVGRFKMRLDLAIERTKEGKILATTDMGEDGPRNMPVSAVLFNPPDVRLEFDQFGTAFMGRLSTDGRSIQGQMEEGPGGGPLPLTFGRDDNWVPPGAVKSALPGEISLIPDPKALDDIRGEWGGTLDTGGPRLRLILKIGRMPDGSFMSTLASPDQGGVEMLSNAADWKAPALKMEWKRIKGTLTADLNPEGTELAGTWEQGGRQMSLKLHRVKVANDSKP